MYVVELLDLMACPATVLVNGRLYEMAIEPTRTAETAAPASRSSESPPAALPVLARVTSVEARTPAPLASVPSAMRTECGKGVPGFQVRAPMPGGIVCVHVRQGDAVCVGQELCTLEAMKMRNAIRSSHDGIIASVQVGEGQTVAYGDVLFAFE
jgi:biotin carboxyl carrier protein